ncbi:MAG: type II toxin-antitoxin system RelE/ParE family toxin [bacterium]
MKLTILGKAQKQIKKLSKIDQIAIVGKIRKLASGAELDIKKMAGYKDIYRMRVGKYRVVYQQTAEEICIMVVQHRSDVYKAVKDLLG